MEKGRGRNSELGGFLKSRRARMTPEEAGLPPGARRRTPGLRREEVAQLAGIGLTWYTWLEQGRPIQVSSYVLDCLSRAFRLNGQERAHLYRLANQPLPKDGLSGPAAAGPALQHVLDSLGTCPSMITDRRWTVVAWNAAAALVFGDFTSMNERERNIVWAVFAVGRYRELMCDWQAHAKSLIARFRAACGTYADDPWLSELVGDLQAGSPEFAAWWPLHEIQGNGEKRKRLNHPCAGALDFEISTFAVSDDSGLNMLVHVPLPGTDTEGKMRALLRSAGEG